MGYLKTVKQIKCAKINLQSLVRLLSNEMETGKMQHENSSPSHVRSMIREGKLNNCSTSGMCRTFLQANIAIVHEDYAKDFRKFTDLNNAPCPLIYQSKVGEVEGSFLAEDSDIRTDLMAYKVYKNGKMNNVSFDLKDIDWEKMVTFYLGCSFTFDHRLLSSGIPVRNIEQGKNVSMYTTSIECLKAGPFSCNMVVSMRPIPKALLDKCVNEVMQLDFLHGAPIHIGNSKTIGIHDLQGSSTIGDNVEFSDGDIPVFWACGVTSSHAIPSAKMPLAFSHSPGCMFISDKTSDEIQKILNTKVYPEARTVCLKEKEQIYSVISLATWEKISSIEKVILDDPGQRGVKFLQQSDDLHHAALSLSQSAKSVGIITGFACMPDMNPPIENDGISGAIDIARSIQALGKPVTLIVGKNEMEIFKDILKWCNSNGILKDEVPVISMGDPDTMLYDDKTSQPRFSHLISIECPGRSSDGIYCTMNKTDISEFCDPLDDLFIKAKEKYPEIVTIGIGDGGNEIGMGKVLENVILHVKHGKEIGTIVTCDYLITTGVSNWGGCALAKAIFLCVTCPVHDRYRRRGLGFTPNFSKSDFVTTVQQEKELLEKQMSMGIRDGVRRQLTLSVDGLDFEPHHANKLLEIENC